jgi:hypothetical protein
MVRPEVGVMRYWITSWDRYGVEFVADITKHHPENWAKTHLFETLRSGTVPTNPLPISLSSLRMRAQANQERQYEIYVFTSDDTINETDLKDWCNTMPQSFANWVRKHHSQCVYDGRTQQQACIV